jgi:hypothetical protein
MGLPTEPVTLNVKQIDELNQMMSRLRHDVNNHLSLMVAALELVRYKPDMAERMLDTISEQPPKISGAMTRFSEEVEKLFGITRP